MKPNFTRWKPQVIKINISSTFVIKNKCLECDKRPAAYYRRVMLPYGRTPRDDEWLIEFYQKHMRRMTRSWYLNRDPKTLTSLKEFSFTLNGKSFKPGSHHKLDTGYTNRITDYLVCPCGKTMWAFNQTSGEDRPEIKNRKGRYSYPRKFQSF
jgi:hypothetical protein